MYNPFSLENKTILVTGASSGIGRGTAIDIAKMGANVILSARNEERLEEVKSKIVSGCNVIKADLSKDEDINNLIERIPNIDGVVFCAGIIKTMPVKRITIDAIDEIFNVNIISAIKLFSSLLKKKKINHGGSVVMISSVSTFNVKVGNSLYSATKGALNSFSKAMALETSKQKIRVNCIQPGFVPSNILGKSGIEQEEFIKWYSDRHPLGLGEPSDIANACIYLLSNASKWATGSIFTIDGGYTLQ